MNSLHGRPVGLLIGTYIYCSSILDSHSFFLTLLIFIFTVAHTSTTLSAHLYNHIPYHNMPANNTNHPASATSSSTVTYVSCPEVQESRGSRPTEAASVQGSEDPWTYTGNQIRLPGASGKTTILSFSAVGTSGHKDTPQRKMTVGTAWTGSYSVSPEGKVLPDPARSKKVSYVIPDGRSVDVDWDVSTEDSKLGEVPLAAGSTGCCYVELEHDKLAVRWRASNSLVSTPGVSSQPLHYCIPLLTLNRLNRQNQRPRRETARKSTLFPLGNSECVPIINSPLPIFSIHHYPCL